MKLNDKYVDEDSEVILTIKFKDGKWTSEQDLKDFSNSSIEDWEDYDVIALGDSIDYWLFDDEIEEFIQDNRLVLQDNEKTLKIKQEILSFLKEGGYETEDLIVSSGRVYIGYEQCETYVQNSGAWLSSSMMC